jgi:hypothetical protein
MTTTTPTATPSRTIRWRTRVLGVGGAVLATALLWTAARVLGIELRVDPRNGQPPGVIDLPFAAAVTFAVSVLGWAVRAMLDRVTRRAAVVWTVLAGIVVLLSLVPVYGVGASTATRTVLTLAHLAVAAVLIPVFGLYRSGGAPRGRLGDRPRSAV